MTPAGLLHSEICGSKPAYGSPQHIAVMLTAPRSISLLAASFFGSQCQGIPLALFVA